MSFIFQYNIFTRNILVILFLASLLSGCSMNYKLPVIHWNKLADNEEIKFISVDKAYMKNKTESKLRKIYTSFYTHTQQNLKEDKEYKIYLPSIFHFSPVSTSNPQMQNRKTVVLSWEDSILYLLNIQEQKDSRVQKVFAKIPVAKYFREDKQFTYFKLLKKSSITIKSSPYKTRYRTIPTFGFPTLKFEYISKIDIEFSGLKMIFVSYEKEKRYLQKKHILRNSVMEYISEFKERENKPFVIEDSLKNQENNNVFYAGFAYRYFQTLFEAEKYMNNFLTRTSK